ncbi:hypothetical protein CHLRE_10g461874v5 [Chlamydomonas reinhardtii]|uniref:Uncharacterized protein n=1 Tax=Chlamydomonas reinhardtii TaxID=3055 RepID=A0A2K3DBY4_CHLRE|nr:uncharacterized protein CHLRE_10g461874v5 [Chlamydomonas reinhardtii]PNW78041.1 hypothetical protein CHLRE_10g461874v5 [Chlamydomonas reinhardtii]
MTNRHSPLARAHPPALLRAAMAGYNAFLTAADALPQSGDAAAPAGQSGSGGGSGSLFGLCVTCVRV